MTNFPLLKIYDGFTIILQLTNEIYMIKKDLQRKWYVGQRHGRSKERQRAAFPETKCNQM